ncbi:MAG: GNAT family N-acetyltransferase [Azospirillum sp.]|nr:GNAT family N-acetyltransferase [Azospirillum sp.]
MTSASACTIDVTAAPLSRDLDAVLIGLRAYNEHHTGPSKARLAAFLRRAALAPGVDGDESSRVVGGAVGFIAGRDFFLDWLWVVDDLRGQGAGSRLLDAIEQAAREHGCERCTLNTFSFQAPAFYRGQGYQVLAEIPDFLVGFTKIYFRKPLTPAPGAGG